MCGRNPRFSLFLTDRVNGEGLGSEANQSPTVAYLLSAGSRKAIDVTPLTSTKEQYGHWRLE